MQTHKAFILLGQLLFPFFDHAMQFTDLPCELIMRLIPYLEPLYNNTAIIDQSNAKKLDKQQNPLKYFCKNVLNLNLVNKKTNTIVNNYFSDKLVFYKAMIELDRTNELTLLYCRFKKNEQEYYYEIKLNFSEEYQNYALILFVHKYNALCLYEEVLTEMRNQFTKNGGTFATYFDICIQCIEDKTIQDKVTAWKNLFNINNAKVFGVEITRCKVLDTTNLYTLPLSPCNFAHPFTFGLLCELVRLKYDERT